MLLPLEGLSDALPATVLHLTQASLRRWLRHHGISRLPQAAGDKTPKRKSKTYPIGDFTIDIAEVQTVECRFWNSQWPGPGATFCALTMA
jgi:hypothetical protein